MFVCVYAYLSLQITEAVMYLRAESGRVQSLTTEEVTMPKAMERRS